MRVLICAATSTEAHACIRGIRQAGLNGSFEVYPTGVGLERAAASLKRRLRTGGLQPDLIVSTGFAGAVAGEMPEASWVVAKSLHLHDGQTLHPLSVSTLVPELAGARPCAVVSVRDVGEAEQLSAGTLADPIVVDMESAALARVAADRGIAFMVLRLVTDGVQGNRFLRFVRPALWETAQFFGKALSWTNLLERGWAEHARHILPYRKAAV